MAGKPKFRDVRGFLSEDDAQQLLRELNTRIGHLSNRMESLEILLAPKTQDRMFERPYQRKLVAAGQEEEVYRLTVPPSYVGVITRMANSWFPNTKLFRLIDNKTMEPEIERIVAPLDNPMAVKLFAQREVVWRARNSDAIEHTFEVFMDGFYIPVDLGERIMNYEV